MAKRFIDTELLMDPFVKRLPSEMKFLWLYLIMNCDNAGMWPVELDVAASRIGCPLDHDKAVASLHEKIVVLDDGLTWFIPSFITFQYKGELNTNNKAHASVIQKLTKYGLLDTTIENEGIFHLREKKIKPLGDFYQDPSKGLQDKDKEKDKDMVKEKESGENEISQITIQLWPTFADFWNAYDKKVGEITKVRRKWECLSQADKEAIMEYLPHYRKAQPDKQFRKNPETFLNNKSWKDEIICPHAGDVLATGYPLRYDPAYEQKLKGQDVTNYHAHLKRLGWEKTYSPGGGTTWKAPQQNFYRHAN